MFFSRGRHYGDLEKRRAMHCVLSLSSRSLSHQFISISAIYVFMVAMATCSGARAAQHQQKAIYLVGAAAAAAKKLPSPSLARCCVLFICALAATAESLHLARVCASQRVSSQTIKRRSGGK